MKAVSTVFLVDDDQAVRDSLGLLLESKGFTVVTYASAKDFLKHYKPNTPGCLVLDIRMPGIDGLELQSKLITNQVQIPIIFITGHGDVSMAVRAIKKGAYEFLEKPFDNKELIKRIKEAIKLDTKIHKEQAESTDFLKNYEQLTPREKEVMALVVAGQPNKLIAKNLFISHRTVEIHRRRVMQKMHADSVSQLIGMAIVCGLHEPQGQGQQPPKE